MGRPKGSKNRSEEEMEGDVDLRAEEAREKYRVRDLKYITDRFLMLLKMEKRS